ncbi:hypothetical protein G7K_3621-t1 [Saitoella complicata NRRL Y-17804]|uniref:Uncharacterized protein n=1 Tax=Saitoella complicata (strain BCRC 22490 / CBS 7301 / JCM 7358 / NBRC 10748 / NRRL Y-17804) TaxID=698492 RepID=A0A0E9NIH2_SAICN|nr:hypothetical protein G7K_3621-t1 [Saitoella complicata NRRL Y-17804]
MMTGTLTGGLLFIPLDNSISDGVGNDLPMHFWLILAFLGLQWSFLREAAAADFDSPITVRVSSGQRPYQTRLAFEHTHGLLRFSLVTNLFHPPRRASVFLLQTSSTPKSKILSSRSINLPSSFPVDLRQRHLPDSEPFLSELFEAKIRVSEFIRNLTLSVPSTYAALQIVFLFRLSSLSGRRLARGTFKISSRRLRERGSYVNSAGIMTYSYWYYHIRVQRVVP